MVVLEVQFRRMGTESDLVCARAVSLHVDAEPAMGKDLIDIEASPVAPADSDRQDGPA